MNRTTSDRALHLVDIENLIGKPRPTRKEVEGCQAAYAEIVGRTDHVVISCSHGAFLTVGFGWPRARHLVRSGPDGADLALLDVLANEGVSERFDAVFLASGDGIFADAAAFLAVEGIEVTAVSRPEALSRRLRLAARRVRYLVSPPHAGAAARHRQESA